MGVGTAVPGANQLMHSAAKMPDIAAAPTPKPGYVVSPAKYKPGSDVLWGNWARGFAAGDKPYIAP